MDSRNASPIYHLYIIVLMASNMLCIEDATNEEDVADYTFGYCLLPKEEDPKPDPRCGRFRWTNDDKIIGGEIAAQGSSPWLGSIQDLQYGEPIHFCGAIIINRFFLLTAAHCITEYSAPYDKIKVVVGEFNLAETDGWEVDLKIKNVIIHPNYDMTNFKFDVAILQVKDPIRFNEMILPIRLPRHITDTIGPNNRDMRKLCDKAKIYGWGKTEYSENPVPILRRAKIPILSYEECQEAYGGLITPPMMCAGNITHGGVATCTGDWGGPLVGKLCKPQQKDELDPGKELATTSDAEENDDSEHNRQFLLGVASWGIGCGIPGYPNVYVDAQQIIDWILDNTRPSTNN